MVYFKSVNGRLFALSTNVNYTSHWESVNQENIDAIIEDFVELTLEELIEKCEYDRDQSYKTTIDWDYATSAMHTLKREWILYTKLGELLL